MLENILKVSEKFKKNVAVFVEKFSITKKNCLFWKFFK